MPREVEAPDGTILEFPDGMADADVLKALRTKYPKKAAAVPTAAPATEASLPAKLLAAHEELKQQTGIGALKGAGETVFGLGKLMSSLGNLAVNPGKALAGEPNEMFPTDTAEQVFPDLKVEGLLQHAGKAGERVAEFAIPGAAEAKVPVSLAMKAGPLASFLFDATNVAGRNTIVPKLAARALASGAEAGGVTAAQTGEVGHEAGINALLGALAPAAIEKAVLPFARHLSETTAPNLINSLLTSSPASATAHGKNPAEAILRDIGPVRSMESMLSKIESVKSGLLEDLTTIVKSPAGQVRGTDIRPILNDAADMFMKDVPVGEKGNYLNGLRNVIEDITKGRYTVSANGAIKQGANPNIPPFGRRMMTAEEVLDAKRALAKGKTFAMDPVSGAVKQAREDLYGRMGDALSAAVPETGPINKRISDLIGAGQAARATLESHPSVLGDLMKDAGTGLVASHLTGGLGGGLTGVLLRRALGSTASKTMTASLLRKAFGGIGPEATAAAGVGPAIAGGISQLTGSSDPGNGDDSDTKRKLVAMLLGL